MRNPARLSLLALSGVLAISCRVFSQGPVEPGPPTDDPVLTISPSGVPNKLLLGLFETVGQPWMKNSGVPWNARYCYLTKGWVDNWGWSDYDGSWALGYMRESDGMGAIPVVEFYQLHGEAGGGEDKFLAKTRDATLMKAYFGDFKILMQRAKDFGKPVYVQIEADGTGFLQNQSASNPEAAAAVASTGMPELAALPNTVAGWSLAFLAIKQAVGASNAFLGMHVSAWAGGNDLLAWNASVPLQGDIDKVHAFLAPLGLAANATGITYDLLVSDPSDRDADYYRLVQNDGGVHWWDASDGASVNSRSFNRYREWLRLWNAKSGMRWLLWQIPLGNSNHLNVNNDGGDREGYKDNRPEYFLDTGGLAHSRAFADVGVIGLLFGAGMGGVSNYGNDIFTDGKSFMQSRGAAFFAAGGVSLGTTVGIRIALPGRFQGGDLQAGSQGARQHHLTAGDAGRAYRADGRTIRVATEAESTRNAAGMDVTGK